MTLVSALLCSCTKVESGANAEGFNGRTRKNIDQIIEEYFRGTNAEGTRCMTVREDWDLPDAPKNPEITDTVPYIDLAITEGAVGTLSMVEITSTAFQPNRQTYLKREYDAEMGVLNYQSVDVGVPFDLNINPSMLYKERYTFGFVALSIDGKSYSRNVFCEVAKSVIGEVETSKSSSNLFEKFLIESDLKSETLQSQSINPVDEFHRQLAYHYWGMWVSSCVPNQDIFERVTVAVYMNEYYKARVLYRTADCDPAQRIYTLNHRVRYGYTSEEGKLSARYEWAGVVTEIGLVPGESRMASTFNLVKLCSTQEWTRDSYKACGTPGATQRGTIQRRQDTLYFNDGSFQDGQVLELKRFTNTNQ